ncbi:hypothetical protein GCM10011571_33470 [Marinithermofilum abyssi]|uniref:Uncharacterized protein n=1 Tax=Marinithermofilum abyssi TaxID=1571185 RepID=A0A8J2VLT8_9BACL|nr:hypothetical protein [Marinithermofilum abyssi]GGE28669.1 hypothetical protein GCM10011571_33470 [Marinithermofilum abyssi]
MNPIITALWERIKQFQEQFSTWSTRKQWLFIALVVLWLGGVLFFWFYPFEKPSDSKQQSQPEKIQSVDPVAVKPPPPDQQPKPESSTQTKQDTEAARSVAKKYLSIYYEQPRKSPQDLAQQLEPYASPVILQSIAESMKVPEPTKIKKLVLSEVKPPFVPDGITYHAIITTDQEEFDYWFTLTKVQGKWMVSREEVM